MTINLQINDLEDIIFNSNKQEYTIDESGTKELYLSYDYNAFNGWYKEILFDNFKIGFGSSKLSNKTNILFDFTGETVEMHFTLKGFSNTKIEHMKLFSMESNSHNIFYCEGIKGNIEWQTKDNFIFEINLLPSFFEQYLPDDKIFQQFKKNMMQKNIGFMNKHNYPITFQMHSIIQQIINCNLKNTFRRLFMESKVLELLMLQMEQIQSFNGVSTYEKTSKNTIEKMHYAKEIISQSIEKPLSLSELSTVLHTNECSLKKDFKSTFGTTVFGYVKELKMNKAKNMLIDNKHTVSEVSDIIGYKNPQHFTTAFKKYFGFVPSTLLEKQKIEIIDSSSIINNE